jgi:aldehyde dehydrogenase
VITDRDQLVAQIAEEVVAKLRERLGSNSTTTLTVHSPVKGNDGVFQTVDEAVVAASIAQKKIVELSLDQLSRCIEAIRRLCADRAEELAKMELAETGVGRLDHKIAKLHLVKNVLGVEAMRSDARSNPTGLCLIERAPWGVIGMVLPVTHSAPTLASNAINILSARNSAIFCPHPSGAKVAARILQLINQAIEKETGIENAITTMETPTMKTTEEVFHHPGVALLTVTGGPAVVKAASKSGKRVIAAGPGNPPVVVDETADLDVAARSIVTGGSFDNNLLCIGEKEIFVVASVADEFKKAMLRANAFELDAAAIDRLADAAFTYDGDGKGCGQAHLKRDLVGKDVSVLAAAAGVRVPAGIDLLFGETNEDHAFVQEEQMMPFVPMVRVKNFQDGVRAAIKAEHGYRHTAIIHSQNIHNVTTMAKAMNTTLFIHNEACAAALGANGAGYLSFSIATPTGEGVTTPMTFTRERQITIGGGSLRII